MLKHRVIPVILIDGYSVLKTIQFNQRRNLGNPITVANTYNTRSVDELVILDIDASKYNETIDLFTIESIANECFMPLTVGGGIRDLDTIQECLNAGADKVTLNTIALEDPDFITKAADRFGSQCIVVSIDIKDGQIYSHSGKETNISYHDYIKLVIEKGAGEIFINDVDNDGKMNGVNIQLINEVSSEITVPLIYTGGVGEPQHCIDAIQAGTDAIAAASIFHFTGHTPLDCKMEISKKNIPVRL